MAFQAAYYGLYGRVESTYEPAMMKGFLHGRTESIRTVQPESVEFVKTFCADGPSHDAKIKALRTACKRHTELTRECSQGQSQDRHLYALSCLVQKEMEEKKDGNLKMPEIFTDPGYSLLSTSVISTSNCGNPALRVSVYSGSSKFQLTLMSSLHTAFRVWTCHTRGPWYWLYH